MKYKLTVLGNLINFYEKIVTAEAITIKVKLLK